MRIERWQETQDSSIEGKYDELIETMKIMVKEFEVVNTSKKFDRGYPTKHKQFVKRETNWQSRQGKQQDKRWS